MSFQIIHNLSNSNNHSDRINQLFETSQEIVIASPYLMTDFGRFMHNLNLTKLKTLHLVTTLCPKSPDQIKKVQSLASLMEFPAVSDNAIECKVSLNNKLHGKVYIFRNRNRYTSAILTSANFTSTGLSFNHEWGVEIDDADQIELLHQSITGSIERECLSRQEIFELRNAANNYSKTQATFENTSIDLDLMSLLVPELPKEFSDQITYWLKPIGVSEEPVMPGRIFDKSYDYLHFSKIKPSGVSIGDIIITCGVGSTNILSVFRVADEALISTKKEIKKKPWLERWPWYMGCNNLSPHFGTTWWNYNFYTSTLSNEYLSLFPSKCLTFRGGKTLGRINFGGDKIKLDQGFARHILGKIIPLENSLKLQVAQRGWNFLKKA